MADAEARVVITARDQTASAFASANKNVQQLSRSMNQIRAIAGLLGVALSGRALAGWISGALKAADATGEQAEAVRSAKDALESMKRASDALAVSIATKLTPAMRAANAVFIGWDRMISGADPAPFGREIANATSELEGLRRKLREMEQFGGYRFDTYTELKEDITAAEAVLGRLIFKQEQALGVGLGGLTKPDTLQEIEIPLSAQMAKMPQFKVPAIPFDTSGFVSEAEGPTAILAERLEAAEQLRKLDEEATQYAIEQTQLQLEAWEEFDASRFRSAAEFYAESKRQEKELADYKEQMNAQARDNISYTLDVIMGLSQGHSKGLFELAKKAAIASAIVNTASGATKALQQGGFWGIAMAAAVVASGAAQIARIRATTFDGAGEGSLTRPGTVVNPLITSPSSSLPSDRMRSGGVAEIHFHGDMYGWDTYIEKKVIGSVRRALDENDMVIFSRDSRQALELAGG